MAVSPSIKHSVGLRFPELKIYLSEYQNIRFCLTFTGPTAYCIMLSVVNSTVNLVGTECTNTHSSKILCEIKTGEQDH